MIGILGGCGDIGSKLSQILSNETEEVIRIGGRHKKHTVQFDNKHFAWMQADVSDAGSLRAFVDGCRIVVNCAGLKKESSAQVAEITTDAGSHYVDLGAAEQSPSSLKGNSGLCAVYGAGSMPGLSGLLPRWLSKKFDRVFDLEFYYAGLGSFTETAARDYLEGLSDSQNKAIAIWKDGRAVPFTSQSARIKVSQQYVRAFPYFDEESSFVAQELRLKNGVWYMGIDGDCTCKALEKIKYNYMRNPYEAVKDLCAASKADCAARKGYAGMLIQLNGERSGRKKTETLRCLFRSPSHFTASATAAVVLAISKHKMPKGSYLLGKSPHTEGYTEELMKIAPSGGIQIYEHTIGELYEEVEGAL